MAQAIFDGTSADSTTSFDRSLAALGWLSILADISRHSQSGGLSRETSPRLVRAQDTNVSKQSESTQASPSSSSDKMHASRWVCTRQWGHWRWHLVLMVVVVLMFHTRADQSCVCLPLPTIKFGLTSPLSGINQQTGEACRTGVLAAFTEYNQNLFGDNKFRVELQTKDDAYDAILARQNVQSFVQDPTLFGIIGAVGTASIEQSAPVALANGLPFLSSYGGMALRKPFQPNVLTLRGSYFDEAASIVEFLISKSKTRIALFAQNDTLGQVTRAGMLVALDASNLYLFGEAYCSKNQTDAGWQIEAENAVANITSNSPTSQIPNAVVIATSYEPASIFIRTLRTIWPLAYVVCLSSVGFESLIDLLAPTLNDTSLLTALYATVFTPNPVASNDTIVQRFRAALALIGVTKTDYTTLENYMIGRLALAALQRIKATNSSSFTHQAFIDQVYRDSLFNLDGFRVGLFTPEDVDGGCNQGIHEVRVVKVGLDKSLTEAFNLSFAQCGYQPKQWETLTFGMSCTFSGPTAQLCVKFREGLLAAFKQINDAGGIRGTTRLRVVSKDDAGQENLALMNNYALLDDAGIFGLIGASPLAVDKVPQMVNETGKILFGAFTGSIALREPFQADVINFRASVDDEIYAIVHHCYYERKIKRVSAVYEDSSYGTSRRDQLELALGEKRWTLHYQASFGSPSDIPSTVAKLFDAGGDDPEAIVYIGLANALVDVLFQVHQRNPKVVVFGLSTAIVDTVKLNSSQVASVVKLENFLVTSTVPDVDDTSVGATMEYRTALTKYNKTAVPVEAGLEGYLVGQLLATSLSRIMGKPLTVPNLLETIYETGNFDLFGVKCGPLQKNLVIDSSTTASTTSSQSSCNQCMKVVYFMTMQNQMIDPLTFEDTCMYTPKPNLDFKLTSLRMVCVALAAICMVYSIFVAIGLALFRRNPHLAPTCFSFSVACCLGAMLCFGGVMVVYPVPSDANCVLRIWYIDLAFWSLFCPLLAKVVRVDNTIRIHSHHHHRGRPKRRILIMERQMVELVCVLGVLFAILLGLFTGLDRPFMQEAFTSDGFRYETCETKTTKFVKSDLVLKGLVLAWGCFAGNRVSNNSSKAVIFQEGRLMAGAFYHSAFVGIIMVLLGGTTATNTNVHFLCMSLLLVANTLVVVTTVAAWPVFLAAMKRPVDDDTSTGGDNSSDLQRGSIPRAGSVPRVGSVARAGSVPRTNSVPRAGSIAVAAAAQPAMNPSQPSVPSSEQGPVFVRSTILTSVPLSNQSHSNSNLVLSTPVSAASSPSSATRVAVASFHQPST